MIKSITVTVGGEDYTLTLKEAKELHSELSELFDTKLEVSYGDVSPWRETYQVPFPPDRCGLVTC